MKRSNVTEAMVRGAARHPYLLAAIVCLCINPFFLGSVWNIPNNALWLEGILVMGAPAAFGIYKYRKGDIDKFRLCVFMGCAFFVFINLTKRYIVSEYKALWHFWGGCAALILLYLLAERKKYREQLNSLMIIGVGFCLKLHYIIVTSVYTRQHDIHSFDGGSGHAGYIEYLLANHRLPDFDPRERWAFYHPPLHHAICAAWIHISENILNVGRDPARESLQTLTLFYSMCIIISAYKIMRYFGLKGKSLYIPLLIVSFHPSFILFSGSINNDVLSVALMMGAVVAVLEWYKNRTMTKIIPVAVCMGLAMMTKMSAIMLVPPVIMVFLAVLAKNYKTDMKELLKQFVCFGVIFLQLGFWFGAYNNIKWEMPLTYVRELDTDTVRYIGDMEFKDRITDFSSYQVSSPYEQEAYYDDEDVIQGYSEFNPLVTLMKDSLFGEYIDEGNFRTMFPTNVAYILFWLNVLIAAAAFAAMIAVCIKKPSVERYFLAMFYVVMMICFYKMAKRSPFIETMNFRYITPTVITGALFLGLASKDLLSKKASGRTVVNVLGECAVVFAFATGAIYLSLY